MKIGDIGRVVTGRTPPSSRPECFSGTCPFITPSDMDGRRKMCRTERTLSEEGVRLLSRIVVPQNSIAVSCIGWQLGKVVLTARSSITNQQINTLIVEDHHDYRFVYYLLKTKRELLMNLGSMGVRTPIVNKSVFSAIELDLPSFSTQRRIASILSAYDDLIENNTRRIAILEEMARRLYDEWFVQFRFPGHEGVPMVDSEIGKVPEGWELSRLGELATVNSQSIKAKAAPENIRYIDIKSVTTGSMEEPRELPFAEAPSRARRVVRSGDILWSSVRPNLKSYVLIIDPEPNTIASTGFAVITPVKAPYSFLYPALTTDEFVTYLVNHTTGAAYPAVNQKDFEAARLIMPPSELLVTYDQTVGNILQLAQRLNRKNTNLRTQRDLLLPKLISGEIDVSEIGEPTEEVAA